MSITVYLVGYILYTFVYDVRRCRFYNYTLVYDVRRCRFTISEDSNCWLNKRLLTNLNKRLTSRNKIMVKTIIKKGKKKRNV